MRARQDPDKHAVEGTLDGDTEMFAHIVLRHQRGLSGFCGAMLCGEGGEDAAQEVFLKAFQALHEFRGDSAFSSWLYRIAFNHCSNLKKSLARRRTCSLEDLSPQAREKAMAAPAATPDGAPELDALAAAMARLPANYRLLIALHLQGKDYAEIAEVAGISVEGVRGRLRRARLILRRGLHRLLPNEVIK